jgi:hypothetical protein
VNAVFFGAALTTEIELLANPAGGGKRLNHLVRPKRPS